jgi:hypothetical protein
MIIIVVVQANKQRINVPFRDNDGFYDIAMLGSSDAFIVKLIM